MESNKPLVNALLRSLMPNVDTPPVACPICKEEYFRLTSKGICIECEKKGLDKVAQVSKEEARKQNKFKYLMSCKLLEIDKEVQRYVE
jgi:hypothetical protein